MIAAVCWGLSDSAGAAADEQPQPGAWGWSVTEIPVFTGSGEQMFPDVEGQTVVFRDFFRSFQGQVLRQGLFSGEAEEIGGPGVPVGPRIDEGGIVWQDSGGRVCRRPSAGGPDQCVATNTASELEAFGDYAVAVIDSNSSVRLVDFTAGSSKLIDSSTTMGSRRGVSIDADDVYWVRERGYAGKYYEPIIYNYHLPTMATRTITKTGGGVNGYGASKYARQQTALSNGHIFYQQKLNAAGATWDIYEAFAETWGTAVVEAPGDQSNVSASGDLIVYQDNRSGHVDGNGAWTGDWNIYMKDLSTGIEQPVCTAAGDQRNPRIDGNVIVWEDRRSGEWDIYGAVIAPASEDRQLMERYSPSMVMHHNEDFRPENAGVMAASPGAVLMEDGVERLRAPESLTLDSLAGFGAGSYLDLPGSCLVCGAHLPDPAFDTVIRSQYVHPYGRVVADGGFQDAVYGRVVRLGGSTVIQYWINYYFNSHPMLSHEGDWELVEVELDEAMNPARVSVSQHGYGKMRLWQDVDVRDGHPVIYVGRGSHANYFEPGNHSIEVAGLAFPMLVDESDDREAGRLLTPQVLPLPGDVVDVPGYKWLNFRGRWGEMNGLPESDAPSGPPWSGDRWENPFAWDGLEWDGFTEGLKGLLVGLEARCNSALKVNVFDAAGGHGEDLAEPASDGIPGLQFLDAPALGQKAICIAGAGELSGFRLELTAAETVYSPLRVSFPDRTGGSIVTLTFDSIEAGPGRVASLTIGAESEAAGYPLQIEIGGAGATDMTLLPDSITRVEADVTPPPAIDDLRADRREDGTVTLRWTAPGDDGAAEAATGAATMYSIRRSSRPITDDNWAAAEPVAVTARPGEAGVAESLEFYDLPPDEALYFAVSATDDAGNESPLSNIAPCFEPHLSLTMGAVFWGSYSDYLSGDLTVRFSLINDGPGPARDVTLEQVVVVPAGVVPGPLPAPVPVIESGKSGDVSLRFHCPPGTRRFATRLYVSCKDITGGGRWFPGPPPEHLS